MSRKHKKFCTTLNHIEHFLILASIFTGCFPISAFASLLGIPIGNTNFAIKLKKCAKAEEIKNISQYLRKRKRSMIK